MAFAMMVLADTAVFAVSVAAASCDDPAVVRALTYLQSKTTLATWRENLTIYYRDRDRQDYFGNAVRRAEAQLIQATGFTVPQLDALIQQCGWGAPAPPSKAPVSAPIAPVTTPPAPPVTTPPPPSRTSPAPPPLTTPPVLSPPTTTQPPVGSLGVPITASIGTNGGRVIRAGEQTESPIAIGSVLRPGDRFVATSADVIITFSDGSRTTVRKGASFELEPATPGGVSMIQRAGRMVSRVFRGTYFSLKAPRPGKTIIATVRGTEFTTSVGEDGSFDLSVSEGLVTVTVGERTVGVYEGAGLHLAPGEDLPELPTPTPFSGPSWQVGLSGSLVLFGALFALVFAFQVARQRLKR